MKIVVASSGLGHVARGVEAWAADLGGSLFERGHSVILCKGGGVAVAPYERVLPCLQRMATKTQRLAKWTRRGFWRLHLGSTYQLEEATFTWQLLKLLRHEAIDILHVQDPHVALFVQRAHRLGWVRTRVILGNGTNEPYDFLNKLTYLHHLTPFYLEQAKTQGCWKPTWTAIPNFINTETFRPGMAAELRAELGIPPHGLVVLCAAAIKRNHKRVDYLVEEFAQLRRLQPELPVWLVVAGGLEPETNQVIEEGRALLGDRVRFQVSFPRSRMWELYRAADLFVLCSLREMMPVALLEATASGLPCLVNRHPSLQWIVGGGGESIDMASPGTLATALGRLAQDVGRCHQLGAEARRHCIQNFGCDRVIDQILEYYRFVLSDERSLRKTTAETVAADAKTSRSVTQPPRPSMANRHSGRFLLDL